MFEVYDGRLVRSFAVGKTAATIRRGGVVDPIAVVGVAVSIAPQLLVAEPERVAADLACECQIAGSLPVSVGTGAPEAAVIVGSDCLAGHRPVFPQCQELAGEVARKVVIGPGPVAGKRPVEVAAVHVVGSRVAPVSRVLAELAPAGCFPLYARR